MGGGGVIYPLINKKKSPLLTLIKRFAYPLELIPLFIK